MYLQFSVACYVDRDDKRTYFSTWEYFNCQSVDEAKIAMLKKHPGTRTRSAIIRCTALDLAVMWDGSPYTHEGYTP